MEDICLGRSTSTCPRSIDYLLTVISFLLLFFLVDLNGIFLALTCVFCKLLEVPLSVDGRHTDYGLCLYVALLSSFELELGLCNFLTEGESWLFLLTGRI